MDLQIGTELGLEYIARAALMTLFEQVNDALDDEDAKWSTLDQELAQTLTLPYYPCTSNKIKPQNFYMGHRPSLIEAPVECYPNLACMAYQSIPSSDKGDQYEGTTASLFIEAMCIDGMYDQQVTGFERKGEDLINRKVQRLTEAIHAVMVSNRTLGGATFEIPDAPQAQVSDCFRRRADNGSGEDYYWQMVRLEYHINKISAY